MTGYLNDQEATDAMIDSDGWVKTGDVGYYDSKGYLYIVDRLKDIIRYKGYQVIDGILHVQTFLLLCHTQIPPSEVENLLLMHPEILDAGVVGLPHKEYGELPSALVALKPGVVTSAEDIKNFVLGTRLITFLFHFLPTLIIIIQTLRVS